MWKTLFLWFLLFHLDPVFTQDPCSNDGRFGCGDGTCISQAKVCDRVIDCNEQTDEVGCTYMRPCSRNLNTALSNNYTSCRKPCTTSSQCRGKKRCVCDDECGNSCINPDITCEQEPPHVANAQQVVVKRASFDNGGYKLTSTSKPYKFGDVATYICSTGYGLNGPFPRCNGKGQWSSEVPECIDYSKCGQAGNVGSEKGRTVTRRSIGGNIARDNAWPWQAAITRLDSNYWKNKKEAVLMTGFVGGGSILSERWILTAANMFENDPDLEDLAVFVGTHKRYFKSGLPSSIKAFEIVTYIRHPSYNMRDYNNDIAMIKIGHEYDDNMRPVNGPLGLTFNYYVRPVCLPCTGACQVIASSAELRTNGGANAIEGCRVEEYLLSRSGSKAIVSGFGHTSIEMGNYRANASLELRQVVLRVADGITCIKGIIAIKNVFPDFEGAYNDNSFCTDPIIDSNVADACAGDGGGPMVREIISPNEKKSCWIQTGIVSFGVGCGTGIYPGYFTNVARYISWINQTMEGGLTGH